MNLKEAAQQALEALEDHATQYPHMQKGYTVDAITTLRAALAEDAMQRLADEQQMIERGTKAWADVPNATAWVDEMRGNVPAPTSQESRQVEPVGYGVFEDGNLHDSFRLEHEAKLFAALKGEHAEVGALYRSPPNQSEDTLGMVEPVAWMRADRGHVDFHRHPDYLPLYTTAPPKRNPMTEQQLDEMFDQAEIAIYIADRQQKEHLEVYSFGVRDAEKWHGIGGEE